MTQEKDVEKELREIEKDLSQENQTSKSLLGKLNSLLSNLDQKVLESNGSITSQGSYVCKAEWHAVMIGFSFPAIAYMLPTPLGEFCIVAMLLMLRVGFKNLGNGLEGHMEDVMHELAYMLVTAALTIAFFEYLTSETLTQVNLTQLLITMLGSA